VLTSLLARDNYLPTCSGARQRLSSAMGRRARRFLRCPAGGRGREHQHPHPAVRHRVFVGFTLSRAASSCTGTGCVRRAGCAGRRSTRSAPCSRPPPRSSSCSPSSWRRVGGRCRHPAAHLLVHAHRDLLRVPDASSGPERSRPAPPQSDAGGRPGADRLAPDCARAVRGHVARGEVLAVTVVFDGELGASRATRSSVHGRGGIPGCACTSCTPSTRRWSTDRGVRR